MPDETNRSYHSIMRETMLPKPIIYQMVRNVKRGALEMKTDSSKPVKKKYWYLSGKSRFQLFHCNQEFECTGKMQM